MSEVKTELMGIGAGTLLGNRYYIARRLGRGATGTVFEARDRALNDQLCALKIIEARAIEGERDLDRFRNEVMVTRKLTHPNIVRTFEFGQIKPGQFFITMEFVKGSSIDQILARNNTPDLNFTEIIHILFEVSKGIAYAHEKGIIHRDLKPGNILVSESGEVKIVDFGLARSTDMNERYTQTGECIGTPFYMAPEQIERNHSDPRSDIYSMGILAYELIVGKPPFIAESWFQLAKKIVNDPLPDMTKQRGKQLPQWFCEFVRKCTEKHAEDRFQSAAEIVDALVMRLEESVIIDLPAIKQSSRNAELAKPAFPVHLVSAPIYRFAPIIAMISLLIAIVLATVGIPGAEKTKVEAGVEKGTSVLDSIAGTLQKLNNAVEVTYKNRKKIDKYLNELEEQAQNEQDSIEGKKSDEIGLEGIEKNKSIEQEEEELERTDNDTSSEENSPG